VQNVIPESEWTPGESWTTVISGFAGTTTGAPLLININVPIGAVNPGQFACQPVVDGNWAGSYASQSVVNGFTKEGAISAVAPWGASVSWMQWSSSRLYASIPAGEHQFSVRCAVTAQGSFVGAAGSMLSRSVIEVR
jgi:hypothetical protein